MLGELVAALWPTATSAEIASLISFEQLQQLATAGSLPHEHQQLLDGYLLNLPGYDAPSQSEAKRLHGYATANFLRSFANDGSSVWEELVREVYAREKKRAVAVTLFSSTISLMLLAATGYLLYQNPNKFSFAMVGVLLLAVALIFRFFVYLPGKRDRELLRPKGLSR